jgi:Histidine kinase
MLWPFNHTTERRYWGKVFALYALTEVCVQLLFFIIINNFGAGRISIIEFHLVMWSFQCLLIWPIWWMAHLVRKQPIFIQVILNALFFIAYTWCWFGPVQDAIAFVYDHLQEVTRAASGRQVPRLDSGEEYSYLNYQLLKHAFRLSWFYLAAYFYNYRSAEKERIKLAIANKELELGLVKWHLNPSFYFKTISNLQQVAAKKPLDATGPILQLARVMEYVIYEAKEKLIAVKKEIRFISNYVQLINQQHGSTAFEITVTGEYNRLRIAPLLLAGIIDKLAVVDGGKEKIFYKIQLQFTGNEMMMAINGMANDTALLEDGGDLHSRLTGLYPGRHFISGTDSNTCKLIIKLDEEK